MSHWFDGFNKVHRFQILPDKESDRVNVFYNSRKTCDDHLEKIRTDNSLKGFSFGNKRDPCESFFKKAQSTFSAILDSRDEGKTGSPSAGNIGVTISINYPGNPGGKEKTTQESEGGIKTLHTKTDASVMQAIHPETLEPIGIARQDVLHPDLKGSMSAAHARSDPDTGDLFNFNLEFGRKPTYRIFQVSAATGKTTILASFQGEPAYIHSLFLTPNYVVFCVWNSFLSKGGAAILWHKNVLEAIAPYDSSKPATWYIIDRKHSKGLVATYESPAFYCFHSINAWEEPSASDPNKVDIFTDLVAYENLDVIKKFYYENLLSTAPGNGKYVGKKGDSCRPIFQRYRLPAVPTEPSKSGKMTDLVISAPKSASMELPTMNGNYMMRKGRYVYGFTDRGKSSFVDGLVKFDAETQLPIFWEAHAQSPGEPIFVADPEGREEDDGVLLSVVLDGNTGKSYLLCLSAKDMTEVGRASVDGVVGFGFHGTHVPTSGRTLEL